MNKKQKKMLYRILITAAMVLVLNLIPIAGSLAVDSLSGGISCDRL